MIDYSNKGVVWYAMKTTYKRELKAKVFLNERSIENFIPMRQTAVVEKGKKKIILKPAIHNLIFVKTDINELNDIKSQLPFLHNCLEGSNNVLSPIIVPDLEMGQFIEITNKSMDKLDYIDLTSTCLQKGTRVKITGGEFCGYQGTLVKVKGIRDKRVVLSIEGLITVALTSVSSDLIEKI
ncbi:MAG: UpxY family transcription antiterminator [Rikenellaceae bacterium]